MSSPDDEQAFVLAVDIGGTKVAITAIDCRGILLCPVIKQSVPFGSNQQAIPEAIVKLIQEQVETARKLPGNFMGVGLSLCGNVDVNTGMSILAPNLGWRYVPLGQMVREACDVPVFAATDVRMAVIAEAVWGAAQNVRDFAWATVGTGYGGYLFLDGKLYGGSHGFAGNFGHFTLDEFNGTPCGCGQTGCYETFVAGPGITRAAQAAAERGESEFLRSIATARSITTQDVFDAEAAGDEGAKAVIDEVIRLISINLGGLVNILDLSMIVMGGGIVHATPNFVDRVSQRIRHYLMTEEAIRDLQIVKESFENSALMGAAADVFVRNGILSLGTS